MVWDVAVIGAGMAGLTCAARLQHMGYRVGIIEKSRGLGGRLATRRLPDAWADHGVRCLEDQGDYTRHLIRELLAHQRIHAWIRPVWHWQAPQAWAPETSHARYVSPVGLTLAAKHLGQGLEILRGQRVVEIALTPTSQGQSRDASPPRWQLALEPLESESALPRQSLTARAIVLAIPAPQAAELLRPLAQQGIATDIWEQVCRVEYHPCMAAIATYAEEFSLQAAQLPWGGLQFPAGHALDWISLEQSKLEVAPPNLNEPPFTSPRKPIVVVQSQANYAQQHLETSNLQAIGTDLLERAGAAIAPWLARPQLLQVHRWRYAFVARPLSERYLLSLQPQPLICCGDWCGGDRIEQALQSGEAAAGALATHVAPS